MPSPNDLVMSLVRIPPFVCGFRKKRCCLPMRTPAGTHLPVTDSCPQEFAPQGPPPLSSSLDAARGCFFTPPSPLGTPQLPPSLQGGRTCLCCQAFHQPSSTTDFRNLNLFFFFFRFIYFRKSETGIERESTHTQI